METPDWSRLPGTLLPGGYEVEQFLSATGSSATFKIRILGDRFTSAVGEFFSAKGQAAEQVQLWCAASQLRHTNISQPLTAGTHDGLHYYVEVQPDETLAGVIAQRALEAGEARPVLAALLEAISYLHQNGFAAGRVDPASVAALGDRVCLRLQGVRALNTPLAANEDATAAGDVKQLGQALFEVLTQGCDLTREAVLELPSPFDSIVAAATESDPGSRATLADLAAMLRGENLRPKAQPAPQPKAEPEPQPPVHMEPAQPSPELELPVFLPGAPPAEAGVPNIAFPAEHFNEQAAGAVPSHPAAQGKAAGEPFVSLSRQRRDSLLEREEGQRPKPSLGVLWITAACLIAAVLLFFALRPKRAEEAKVVAQPAQQTSQAAWPSHEVGPGSNATSRTTSAAAPAAHLSTRPEARATNRSSEGRWRVIAYTFRRQAEAEKRAKSINERHPNLRAEVFSPRAGAPYLVSLGGMMTREAAEQLRSRARGEGLPRDTYVQNY